MTVFQNFVCSRCKAGYPEKPEECKRCKGKGVIVPRDTVGGLDRWVKI